MKYLFLAYGDEQLLAAMSTSERDMLQNACISNDEALRTSGRLIAMERIQRTSTTTVRFQNGQVAVADIPCVESKSQLVGIFTVHARDLNEAIQVASTMPQARGGPIEVRPILELEHASSKLC